MNVVLDIPVLSCLPQGGDRQWPQTNCYVDLWLGVLPSWGFDPFPGLAFCVTQDFEGDQFTFFKYPHDDLERMYGIFVQELSVYRPLEAHALEMQRLGRLTVAEVDGFWLPDTRATSYRTEHTKTTIGIERLDADRRECLYFHSAGCFKLEGEDYDNVFRRLPRFAAQEDILPPFVEFAYRRWTPLQGEALVRAGADALRRHVNRRPESSPVARYRAAFQAQVEALMARPDAQQAFHPYAFNTVRQLGSNFELLGSFVRWLDRHGHGGLEEVEAACGRIAATAKALQFRIARTVNRKRFDPAVESFDTLEAAYAEAIGGLAARFG